MCAPQYDSVPFLLPDQLRYPKPKKKGKKSQIKREHMTTMETTRDEEINAMTHVPR